MSSTDRLSNLFLNTLNENLLQNVCLSPTRGHSILALIITRNPDIIYSVEIEEQLANSDHNSVRIEMRFPIKRVNAYRRTIYLYSKEDYENMNEELDQISLNKYDPQQRHGHKLETFQISVSNLDTLRQIRPMKGD